jgi:glycerol kinase
VVQWLRDGLGAIRSSAEVQALAETVPDSGGVMLVPAFTGLGAPYWNPEARGTITGLTRGSTTAHIARAALESIAFQSAALLQAMARDAQQAGAAAVTELRVDGGACINDLLMQVQADLLGMAVVRPVVTETTALGAAYLAGLSCGLYPSTAALSQLWKAERRFEPRISTAQAHEKMQRCQGGAGRPRPLQRCQRGTLTGTATPSYKMSPVTSLRMPASPAKMCSRDDLPERGAPRMQPSLPQSKRPETRSRMVLCPAAAVRLLTR